MIGAPAVKSIQPVLDWLIDGARSDARSEEVLAALCQRLVACGMPACRVGVVVTTLHPSVMGRPCMWEAESRVKTSQALVCQAGTGQFRKSALARSHKT